MTRENTQLQLTAGVLLILGIYAVAVTVARSEHLAREPELLSLAIVLDLVVTAPAVAYWLIIRPGHAPAFWLVPMAIIGMLVGSRLAAADQGWIIRAIGMAWATLELALAAFFVVRVRRLVTIVRAARARGHDTLEAVEQGLIAILPASRTAGFAARFLVHELSALYHGLFGWFWRAPAVDGTRSFSHHRGHPVLAMALVVALLVTGEAVALHIVVRQWAPMAAWALTGLHIYTLLWVIGDYHAMRCSRIVVTGDAVHIAIGLRLRMRIDRADIVSVEAGADPGESGESDESDESGHLRVGITGSSSNFVIRLRGPRTATLLFGRQRACSSLALRVDDPHALAAALAA